jgi:tRNA pseudouridine55 synthase
VENVINIYKQIGETPLEALEKARLEYGIPKDISMTYAGRLDPMAEGVLIVLVGEECKNKEKYLGFDKEYEVEVLFGFGTDTYDLLGKVKGKEWTARLVENAVKQEPVSGRFNLPEGFENKDILEELEKFKGKFVQEYPAYSSKTVDGVQLHTLANKGELPNIMPTKEVEIYNIEILDDGEIQSGVMLDEIKNKINKVKGEFRQKEILELWQIELEGQNKNYKIIKLKISCSSGTYMRTLAHNIGKAMGVPALAYSIKRKRVGQYSL